MARRSLNEKRTERALIARLKGLGCYAAHVDCGIDGFPDMIVGSYGAVALVEVKDAGRGLKVKNLFEDTQPVFYHEWCSTGGTIYVVLGGGEEESSLWKITTSFIHRLGEKDLWISDVATIEARGCLRTIAQALYDQL